MRGDKHPMMGAPKTLITSKSANRNSFYQSSTLMLDTYHQQCDELPSGICQVSETNIGRVSRPIRGGGGGGGCSRNVVGSGHNY